MDANFTGYIHNTLQGYQQKPIIFLFGLGKDVVVNAIIVKATLKSG